MEEANTGGLAALGTLTQEADDANPDPGVQAKKMELEAAKSADEQSAQEWAQVLFVVGGTVCIIAPELKPLYSQANCLQWGEAAQAVAKKYHWDAPALPEIALAAATMHIAVPTFFVIREKIRTIKEGKAEGLAAKIGMWWRARQARKAGQVASPEAANDGSK